MEALVVIVIVLVLIYALYKWQKWNKKQVRKQPEREKQVEPKTVEKILLTEQSPEAQYEANEPKYRNHPGAYPPDWEWRKRKVKKRDKYTCQASPEKVGLPKCGRNYRDEELDVHHIIPISKGGKHSFENLITLCSSCHGKLHPHLRLGLDVEISITDRQIVPQVRLLQNAIANAKDVWMDYYTAYRNSRNKRTVTPRNVYYRNGAAYLRAYDYWRKEERTFKVSRIINMRVLDSDD